MGSVNTLPVSAAADVTLYNVQPTGKGFCYYTYHLPTVVDTEGCRENIT